MTPSKNNKNTTYTQHHENLFNDGASQSESISESYSGSSYTSHYAQSNQSSVSNSESMTESCTETDRSNQELSRNGMSVAEFMTVNFGSCIKSHMNPFHTSFKRL